MKKFILANGKKFFIHPLYKKYAASEDGVIIHVKLGKPRKGNLKHDGYLYIGIYINQEKKVKSYSSHRFVFECFSGLIEKNKQINHINFIRTDNRLKNLEVVTPSENNKKSTVNKNYTFLKDIRKKPKSVLATNLKTKKEIKFESFYSAGKMLGINSGLIKMICDGKKYCKTANSKVEGCKYTFHYI